MTTGHFYDPNTKTARLTAHVLSTHNDLHFVEVTHRNSVPLSSPYRAIVPASEFVGTGANRGYWARQLRGKDGQFIEMGGGIEWADSKGKRHLGTVSGFDDENEKVIIKDSTGKTYRLSSDEIKSTAVKAVIPPPKDTDMEPSEGNLSDLEADLNNVKLVDETGEEITPEAFDKFPVGKALDIKDSNNRTIATVKKQKDPDSPQGYSLIINLLLALLPNEIFHLFQAFKRSQR